MIRKEMIPNVSSQNSRIQFFFTFLGQFEFFILYVQAQAARMEFEFGRSSTPRQLVRLCPAMHALAPRRPRPAVWALCKVGPTPDLSRLGAVWLCGGKKIHRNFLHMFQDIQYSELQDLENKPREQQL